MSDAVRDNILSPAQWLRILYMVIFAVVSWALGIVLTVLIVLQALFSLVTGKDNENLRQLGGSLSKYYYQILLFLTYKSEEKPFPFAPFPDTPGAAPLDPVAPAPVDPVAPVSPAGSGAPQARATAHASTVNTPSPVASADFVSEHEPEVAGSINTVGIAEPSPDTTRGVAAAAPAEPAPAEATTVDAPSANGSGVDVTPPLASAAPGAEAVAPGDVPPGAESTPPLLDEANPPVVVDEEDSSVVLDGERPVEEPANEMLESAEDEPVSAVTLEPDDDPARKRDGGA